MRKPTPGRWRALRNLSGAHDLDLIAPIRARFPEFIVDSKPTESRGASPLMLSLRTRRRSIKGRT